MIRKSLPVLLSALALVAGCAGPAKLTQQSEEKLAKGEPWRAWALATRALDKAPGNPAARTAATRAAGAIATDWCRRVRALAQSDSIAAGEQVLEFASFRLEAARYATVPTPAGWIEEEGRIRASAARIHYAHGVDDLATHRPRRAYVRFMEAQRFVPDYRDAAKLATRALERGHTRVAFVPLRSTMGGPTLGRDAAAAWRGEVAERLSPTAVSFTQILPSEDIENRMTLASLGRMSRDEAIRLGRKIGADRIVWGTVGDVDAKNSVHVYSNAIAQRIVERDAQGRRTTRWVEVPFEAIARVRTVTADVEYEVIATRGGATLARRRDPCTMSARAVWTAFSPVGGGDSYALVSDAVRSSDPERAKQIESRWSAVVGEGTTLAQVIDAKRASRDTPDRREAVARLIAGAAFVMLEQLPPTEELALGAVSRGWRPVFEDLLRLDAVDDVDLGLTAADTDR